MTNTTVTTIKQGALDALDGMQQIVEREMVTKGTYVTQYVADPELKDSICEGRKYCALGALWVGAGITPVTVGETQRSNGFSEARLPGIVSHERKGFMADHPALQRAYTTLNQVAVDYAESNDIVSDNAFDSELETLFESDEAYVGRDGLLEIIQSARQIIQNGT